MAEMLTLAALAADPDRIHLIDVRNADDDLLPGLSSLRSQVCSGFGPSLTG